MSWLIYQNYVHNLQHSHKLCYKINQILLSCYLGAYVPQTMKGNIVVDGVLVSCYPSTHHDLAHMSMAPMRWFPELIMWIMSEENGFSGFVKIAEATGSWLTPSTQQWIIVQYVRNKNLMF